MAILTEAMNAQGVPLKNMLRLLAEDDSESTEA